MWNESLVPLLILAVIQGITEFIPVSSSGHLVLARHLLGFDAGEGALVEIVLHAGSLVAILLYYRRRLWELCAGVCGGDRQSRREAALIGLGCLPVAVVYLVAGLQIESLFHRPRLTAFALVATGAIVLSNHWSRRTPRPLNAPRALGIGLAQVLSLLPGISRSGTTIATARHLGLRGEQAAAYSFLMLVPLLGGATLIGAWRLSRGVCTGAATTGGLLAGFMVSTVVSLAAIHVLIRALQRERFWYFGLYALVLGIGALTVMTVSGR